ELLLRRSIHCKLFPVWRPLLLRNRRLRPVPLLVVRTLANNGAGQRFTALPPKRLEAAPYPRVEPAADAPESGRPKTFTTHLCRTSGDECQVIIAECRPATWGPAGMRWQGLTLLCQKLQQFDSDLVLRRPRSSRGRLEGRRLGLALMVRDAARRARLLTMRPREFRVF